jgi:tetratricopeptide (TPR) repeat protein
VIDDELLQELLSKASGLYNNGEYRGAIDVWKEVLQLDGTSQKAREGIQMATLLLAGWETPAEEGSEPMPAAPADGAPTPSAGLSRQEIEARLDAGVARVHALLKERKYSEAIEGARDLVPIDPDSDEVQRLIEEAQQAFESAPFIEEHLLLARELAAQDRFDEAETECRKVFALDATNPEGHALSADLRRRAAAAAGPKTPSIRAPVNLEELSDVGGSTVKIDMSQIALQRPAPVTPAADPAAETIPEPLQDDRFDLDMEPAMAAASEPAPEPDAEAVPGLDAAPELEAIPEGDSIPEMETAPDPGAAGEPAFVLEEDGEVVDATTVVPPAQRLVPRAEAPEESAEDLIQRLERDPIIQPTPAQAATHSAGWEEELESLNVESGAHEIIGRSASVSESTSPQPAEEADLSSLLDDDIGSIPGMEPEGRPKPAPAAAPATAPSAAPAAAPQPAPRSVSPARAVQREAPGSAAPPAEPRSRASLPTYFALFGLILVVAGGAAWWFLFQPRTAEGRGAAAPPAGSPPSASSGLQQGGNSGPIPTPIGATSKQAIQPLHPQQQAPAPSAPDPSYDANQAPAPSPAGGERPSQAPSPATAAPGAAAPVAPAATPEIVVRPKSPEDLKRDVARHMADGKRLVAQAKWREARSEFASALALDPVNFECKELLDQTQTHVDQELKVQKELDEAKQAFNDKDYQGALWKLYRLPKSPVVGNADLYIRNAWFNWAVVGLKGGDATDARQKLTEVLNADPDDAEAQKLQEIAVRYASKPKDHIYYSFVDTLHFRAFDQP